MSEMDWETSGQPFPTHPSIQRERCPYRPPADAAGNFQFPGLLSQPTSPNMPSFHPQHAPPQTFWDSFSPQNMPPHEGMNNRFVQMSNTHPPGRASEIANFDYHMGLDGHSPPSGPTRHSRFDGSRPLPQRTRSYHNGMQSSAEAQAILALGASQSTSSGAVDLGSSYNGGVARRNGSAHNVPQEHSSANLQASPSRHLPPPNSAYHGLFLGQNNSYPQPRFSPDGTARTGTQGSTPAMPPNPPTIPRETSWARAESDSRNSTHRNWFHEAFHPTQNADIDSDEELTEPQEESLRRQARLDPHATLQLLHEQMRLAGGPRRVNALDAEGPETSLERARAARRAAAAAVKFVASSAALASLESVDPGTLTGDEKSCIICYNEFGVKNPDGFIECPVRLPKCKHTFGDRCLKQWLQDSDSCPYCRDKLPSEPKRIPREDDVRRLIAQTRSYATDPWYAAEMSRIQGDPASHTVAPEREQHYRQLMQQRQDRNEDSSDDISARMRRREDFDWSTSFNQSSIGAPSRSMPDYDGRRRYRGRHSVSRTATQAAGRANGPNSNRLSRNVSVQAGPMRAPVHSSTSSFDENSASQRRSVTPHPTITGIPTWSNPPQLQNSTSGRPSSLPTERSPLGEATEVRPNALNSRTPSGSSIIITPSVDTSWMESHHTANNALAGWRMPLASNGRPASTSFINEMPQVRLQQFHEDLDSLGVHIQNHRLPPYMTVPNDADPDTHMASVNRR